MFVNLSYNTEFIDDDTFHVSRKIQLQRAAALAVTSECRQSGSGWTNEYKSGVTFCQKASH